MTHYELSVFLSKLIGLSFVVFSIAIVSNISIYKSIARKVSENPLVLFLIGTFELTAGLIIVLAHNDWVNNWTVLVTIAGWIFLVRGILRLVFPRCILKIAPKISRHLPLILSIAAAIGFVYGGALLYFGTFLA